MMTLTITIVIWIFVIVAGLRLVELLTSPKSRRK
jgi:hypothetical protein